MTEPNSIAATPTRKDEQYSHYELRAIYARDTYGNHTIEQLIECTAPSKWDKSALKELVADTTHRPAHSITELEIIASGERDHVEDTAVHREGEVVLGP